MRTIQTVSGGQTILISERGVLPEVLDEECDTVEALPESVRVGVYHSSSHPKGGSICYLIEYQGKRLVFATDTEGYIGGDVLLGEFVRGVDVLVHDAEYTDSEYTGPPIARQGYGHSTWKMAVAVGKKAQVKRLILTHHHARHDDAFLLEMEKEAQAVFPPTSMAREGMTIEL